MTNAHRLRLFVSGVGLSGLLLAVAALPLAGQAPGTGKDLSNPGPFSPREELATFRVADGFRVELVASEPDVIDPVAMAFDEEGRIFVAEMRGYPNEGVATGEESRGRVKLLTDKDGDGVYETSTTFLKGLRFPTSVMPWNGGLLVANAPDILFAKDTDGDGKADETRVLYTGFDLRNIQQLINSLQWGLDNWVYGVAGNYGGEVRSAEKPDAPPVTLRGRGVRFRPDVPASLEPTSGGGQYGLASDEFQRWFTATNSQHLRHIVIPDEYLRRNPYLSVGSVTIDIPDHGAACKVFRVSAFEAWRVERTTRRAGGPDAKRFSKTELVPGGFITSACSPVVYCADSFPEAYHGNTFVCDPANNLIHRDVLVPDGATFVAKRADEGCEFLASTDNWFRPVYLCLGPDGALYVLDFYREVIETPLSLPEDIKARVNLESRGRGRIWRIAPEDRQPARKPDLRAAKTAELVKHLADPNQWWRLTAQRLLVERKDRGAIPDLEKLAATAPAAAGRAHALWTLQGLGALKPGLIIAALKDADAGVREQALRLADLHLSGKPDAALENAVLALAGDADPRVRFQLAFTLASVSPEKAGPVLADILRREGGDRWMQTAALSSAAKAGPELLLSLLDDPKYVAKSGTGPLLTRLAAMIGASEDEQALAAVLKRLGGTERPAGWEVAVLEGLGQGLQNSKRPLARVWDNPPAGLRDAVERAVGFFRRSGEAAADAERPARERLAAVRLLGYSPAAVGVPALAGLLTPQTPADLQLAALRALGRQDDRSVADHILEGWPSYTPGLRREALEVLFARPDRLERLLEAVERKQVAASELGPDRAALLRKHPNAVLRKRAEKLLAGVGQSNRGKVVESYRAALGLKGDVARGREVFRKNCASCHRLEDVGTEVGANLLAALPNKTPEALLLDVLDPNREVDPRYLNYLVTTLNGRTYSGVLAAESPSSITLRRAEKAEDTLLRAQIDEIRSTGQSLMPEELEKQLTRQDVADVIAYLMAAARGGKEKALPPGP